MATRGEAESALFDAIIHNAEEAKKAEKGEAADAIDSLAQAWSRIVHGPQGGRYDFTREANDRSESLSKSESVGRTEHKGSSDYHETRHDGEERERPGPGFGG